ncbi:hypothetical protein D3C87_2130030 [compost metagenome]
MLETTGFCKTNTLSNPTSSTFPIDRMNMMMIVEAMPGIVIWIICFHLFAPSIPAASYKLGSIELKAAR